MAKKVMFSEFPTQGPELPLSCNAQELPGNLGPTPLSLSHRRGVRCGHRVSGCMLGGSGRWAAHLGGAPPHGWLLRVSTGASPGALEQVGEEPCQVKAWFQVSVSGPTRGWSQGPTNTCPCPHLRKDLCAPAGPGVMATQPAPHLARAAHHT